MKNLRREKEEDHLSQIWTGGRGICKEKVASPSPPSLPPPPSICRHSSLPSFPL
jgi:hypothetical protein